MLAALTGYLIGSVPTAGFLAGLKGIDLRSEGSANPGSNNALQTGGPLLGASVLIVEAAKGFGAVSLGYYLADDIGAIAAGIGAVAGNVFNIWYRFDGGKGLGISLGVLAAAWPWVLPYVLGLLIAAVLIIRSAGIATLMALAGLIVLAIIWKQNQWSTGGIEPDTGLIVLAMAMTAIMGWKHWRDSPLNPTGRSEQRTPA